VEDDVLSALENLGYQRAIVQKAMAVVAGVGKQTFDELFRKTLGVLAK
jgi:Holliday junction resolvasome RuvABC DNA-binding subunit